MGEQYANEMNYEIVKYPALWQKYGKGAGVIRNEEMAKDCDLAIVFWDGKSRGTAFMIALAEKHNKSVIIKRIPKKKTVFEGITLRPNESIFLLGNSGQIS